jgi:hypothetical protein
LLTGISASEELAQLIESTKALEKELADRLDGGATAAQVRLPYSKLQSPHL